jgi:hypothetical protein
MNFAVLRLRKGVPGVGRKIARHLGAQEIVAANTVSFDEPCVLVNYGVSKTPKLNLRAEVEILNHPSKIKNASNKLNSFRLFREHGVSCVDWTQDKAVVVEWLVKGHRVFARHQIAGKKGQGIEIIPIEGGQIPLAPLYTREFKKNKEHRVHVFQGKVIDVTQKKRMSEAKVAARGYERQKDIRNKANGWVFAHENILWDNQLGELAIAATKAVGLDFCGVDILSRWTKYGKLLEAVVCEVNSAPGMSKTRTFNAYINAIKAIGAN